MESSAPSPRRLRPTDVLKHEHRQIELRLEQLSQTLRLIGRRGGEPKLLAEVEEIARYIDEEMAVHHRKEEEGLFPFLTPFLEQTLQLDGRIADHDDLRIMSGKFRKAIDDCRTAAPGGNARFAAQMLKGYGLYIVHLVMEHLLKEDQILFLVAERHLTQQQDEEIFLRFQAIEAGH
jgi:hemerythrin-like domain-containing protein